MILGLVGVLGLLCLALERARPDRALPRVAGWTRRALLLNATQVLAVGVGGITWERWFGSRSLFALDSPVLGGVVAYIVSSFVYYVWHRLRHEVPILWRLFHQLHHSPRRIEVLTAFYKHPAEQLANAMLSSCIAYPLFGLTPGGAAVYTVLAGLAEFFYHLNVRTPRWVGWFVQRPEMHRVHHEHGRHASNYGDLPIWDHLFGTLRNPARFDGACGFDADREMRVADMLAFRDVHVDSPLSERRSVARRVALVALLVFGLAATVASLLEPVAGSGVANIGRVAKLSLVSPAPKVFCRMGDEEPFAFEHVVELDDGEGHVDRVPLDRRRYARFEAPYAYRNVYGAVLAFAPLLREDTIHAVLEHGFCSDRAPLLDVADGDVGRPRAVIVTSRPMPGALGEPRTTRIECGR